jgi:hypothetical protein
LDCDYQTGNIICYWTIELSKATIGLLIIGTRKKYLCPALDYCNHLSKGALFFLFFPPPCAQVFMSLPYNPSTSFLFRQMPIPSYHPEIYTFLCMSPSSRMLKLKNPTVTLTLSLLKLIHPLPPCQSLQPLKPVISNLNMQTGFLRRD